MTKKTLILIIFIIFNSEILNACCKLSKPKETQFHALAKIIDSCLIQYLTNLKEEQEFTSTNFVANYAKEIISKDDYNNIFNDITIIYNIINKLWNEQNFWPLYSNFICAKNNQETLTDQMILVNVNQKKRLALLKDITEDVYNHQPKKCIIL